MVVPAYGFPPASRPGADWNRPISSEVYRPLSVSPVRHGITSLFAARDVGTGKVIGRWHRRHRQQKFVTVLADIGAAVPAEDGVTVHRIMDNYATHTAPAVKRWLARHPRFVVHFTPTRGSWLNQVERFFAEITGKRIRRGVFETVKALE